MEAVAVDCCELGDLYLRGARPAPETVTIGWDEFVEITNRLSSDAEIVKALRDLVVESGGNAIPNSSLTVARNKALAALSKLEGRS